MDMQLPIDPGDTLTSLAQQHLGDFSKWREIADLNDLNPLDALPIGGALELPQLGELQNLAAPLLGSVAQGLNGEAGKLAATLEQAQTTLSGYVKEAQAVLGEVNGVLGEVETVVQQKLGDLSKRDYQQEGVRLVDWLLN